MDVNEQNPDLELLVEKKMWEIDMESVTESSKRRYRLAVGRVKLP